MTLIPLKLCFNEKKAAPRSNWGWRAARSSTTTRGAKKALLGARARPVNAAEGVTTAGQAGKPPALTSQFMCRVWAIGLGFSPIDRTADRTDLGEELVFFCCRLRSLTPGPPPFSSINSTPARLSAVIINARVSSSPTYFPVSMLVIVFR
jgi:hypothetical protein